MGGPAGWPRISGLALLHMRSLTKTEEAGASSLITRVCGRAHDGDGHDRGRANGRDHAHGGDREHGRGHDHDGDGRGPRRGPRRVPPA